MVSDRGMKPLHGDQQLRSVSLSYSVALQALKPKSSPRRIRAWMQAPIEVSRREGEVFLLDILSHRMSVMADVAPIDIPTRRWKMFFAGDCPSKYSERGLARHFAVRRFCPLPYRRSIAFL